MQNTTVAKESSTANDESTIVEVKDYASNGKVGDYEEEKGDESEIVEDTNSTIPEQSITDAEAKDMGEDKDADENKYYVKKHEESDGKKNDTNAKADEDKVPRMVLATQTRRNITARSPKKIMRRRTMLMLKPTKITC